MPRKALYEEKFVYVIENGKLSYLPVQVARRQPDYVIVNGGLDNGALLVVEMLQGVSPGMSARSKRSNGEDSSR